MFIFKYYIYISRKQHKITFSFMNRIKRNKNTKKFLLINNSVKFVKFNRKWQITDKVTEIKRSHLLDLIFYCLLRLVYVCLFVYVLSYIARMCVYAVLYLTFCIREGEDYYLLSVCKYCFFCCYCSFFYLLFDCLSYFDV